jgi:hypothetical protein
MMRRQVIELHQGRLATQRVTRQLAPTLTGATGEAAELPLQLGV